MHICFIPLLSICFKLYITLSQERVSVTQYVKLPYLKWHSENRQNNNFQFRIEESILKVTAELYRKEMYGIFGNVVNFVGMRKNISEVNTQFPYSEYLQIAQTHNETLCVMLRSDLTRSLSWWLCPGPACLAPSVLTASILTQRDCNARWENGRDFSPEPEYFLIALHSHRSPLCW